MCLDPVLYYLGIVVTILMGLFVTIIWGSLLTLKYFPTSNVSSFIRRHIITDEDLEPKG